MLRGIVIALCLVGCLREPKFTPRDAETEGIDALPEEALTAVPNVTAAMGAGNVVVSGEFFAMTFSNTGARYPINFSIRDANNVDSQWLAGPSGENCFDEQGTGVGLYPIARVSGHPMPAVASPAVVVSQPGPAVAQATITWNQSYCGADFDVAVTSIFTFFPDGRIHRYDDIDTDAQAEITPTTCPCAASPVASNFFFTTYMTLDDNVVARIEDPTRVLNTDVLNNGSHVEPEPENRLCVVGNLEARRLAIGFEPLLFQPRVRRVTAQTLTIVKDYFNFDGAPTTRPVGTASHEMATTMLASRSATCPALFARLGEIASAPSMTAQHGSMMTVLDVDRRDGIYSGPGSIASEEVVLTSPTAIRGSFAVKLQFTSPRQFDVRRVNATDNGGAFQAHPGNTGMIVWLRGGLAFGESVIVRATPI